MMTATYSPDDNKLRLYSSTRLDAETYARVKAAGFRWAPRQELFVAPMWTPEREDLLLELCGEIGDEDTSLVDRAEQRAERFETYSEKRAADAEGAYASSSAIAERFAGGQPILVGHHSEKRARKDAERIENSMRKAVKAWETSKYWTDRAEGAIAHAKYKELPAVRNRRIGTIGADKRKVERSKAQAEELLRAWTVEGLTLEAARRLASIDRYNLHCARDENGLRWSAYDVLRPDDERYKICPAWTVEMIQDRARKSIPRTIAHLDRWIAHYENRLTYERAMLVESGWTEPPKPKTKADLPLLNYGGKVSYRNPYTGEIVTSEAIPITKAQLAAINQDYKGTRVSACGTHRVRTAMHVPGTPRFSLSIVYLSDSKQHARPDAATVEQKAAEEKAAALQRAEEKAAQELARVEARREAAAARAEQDAKDAAFRNLKDSLRAGVQVVTAPQLFPTPPEIVERMLEVADIRPDMRVLEPSAGTGNIADAIAAAHPDTYLVCNELNMQLVRVLDGKGHRCTNDDFLEFTAPPFDRIVMNPPFENGADIRHIEHARTLLKPGGRLVAICAAGPRQRAKLEPIADTWEDLPADSFKSSGTSVNTALVVIEAPEAEPMPASTARAEQVSLFGGVR